MEATHEPLVLGTREACELLGVSEPKLRQLIREGRIATIAIDRHVRIARAEIDDFLGRSRVVAESGP